MKSKSEVISAIQKELIIQKDYLHQELINTIYFGGGTPSILSEAEINEFIETINANYKLSDQLEITLEANPDDISKTSAKYLFEAGINRASLGIQSFNNSHLKFLNRNHNASQARDAFYNLQLAGIENISIDLIYGIHSDDHGIWKKDLTVAMKLNPKHVSAYCLTIEPNTVFGNWQRKNKLPTADEEFSSTQFEMLIAKLDMHGYQQYEISNFAQPNFISQHNSNYWKNEKYLGVGPSAHSFNLDSRQFNIRQNLKYLNSIDNNLVPYEREELDVKTRVNEFIMTTIRTIWGCDMKKVSDQFGVELETLFEKELNAFSKNELIIIKDKCIYLTNKGKLLADAITEKLFIP